jgi:hypothetical protein
MNKLLYIIKCLKSNTKYLVRAKHLDEALELLNIEHKDMRDSVIGVDHEGGHSEIIGMVAPHQV